MDRSAIFDDIAKFLHENRDSELKDLCDSLHPQDLAALLAGFTLPEQLRILNLIGREKSADVICRLSGEDQENLTSQMPDGHLAEVITYMPSDDRVDLFKRLPPDRREKILGLMVKAEREDIRRLGAYAEGTAGSIMSSDYAALTPGLTIQEALRKIRMEAPDKETIYNIYVIDDRRRLLGAVSLRSLIMARPENTVAETMALNPVFARVEDDQEDVARKLNKYDLIAIPVINGNDALVGIVTFDDVHDVMVEETTEDFHLMGALSHKAPPGLTDVNMRDAGLWLLIQRRLPWLLVLVFMNIFSGAGIAYFEDTIEAVVALVFFLPLLIDCGGNAGSQASTLMVRALATGKAHMKDWFALLQKEVLVALGLGLCMGLAVSFIGVFRAGPDVAVVVSITMVCTVLFGSLVGMSLPFVLSRLRLDPATASAPLVTSIADIGGVLIYFSIATWFLRDIIAGAV